MGQKVAHKKSRKPAVLRAPAIFSRPFPSFSFPFSASLLFRLPGSSEARRRTISEKSFFHAPDTPQRCPQLTDNVKALFPTPRTP